MNPPDAGEFHRGMSRRPLYCRDISTRETHQHHLDVPPTSSTLLVQPFPVPSGKVEPRIVDPSAQSPSS